MTHVTDREIELEAEVERLRKLVRAVSPISPDKLTPDQLRAWREEYRDRAVLRALLDECERARDEVVMLRKEVEQLREERNGWGGRAQEAEAHLAKAREALQVIREFTARRQLPLTNLIWETAERTLKEIGE